MSLDILVLAAHPDDAELGCGGTIARHVAAGYIRLAHTKSSIKR